MTDIDWRARAEQLWKHLAWTWDHSGQMVAEATLGISLREAAKDATADLREENAAMLESLNLTGAARAAAETKVADLTGLLERQSNLLDEAHKIRTALEKERDLAAARVTDAEQITQQTESTLTMYAKAWAREIGAPYRAKTHEIDALVLTTRDRIAALRAAEAKVSALERRAERAEEELKNWLTPADASLESRDPPDAKGPWLTNGQRANISIDGQRQRLKVLFDENEARISPDTALRIALLDADRFMDEFSAPAQLPEAGGQESPTRRTPDPVAGDGSAGAPHGDPSATTKGLNTRGDKSTPAIIVAAGELPADWMKQLEDAAAKAAPEVGLSPEQGRAFARAIGEARK